MPADEADEPFPIAQMAVFLGQYLSPLRNGAGVKRVTAASQILSGHF